MKIVDKVEERARTRRKILAFLRQAPLFRGLTEAEATSLSVLARPIRLSKRAYLFREGDPAQSLFLVVEGRLKVMKISGEGKEQVLHVFGPGQTFAEAALFGKSYPASAAAAATSLVAAISKESFVKMLGEKPDIGLRMIAGMAHLMRTLVDRIEDLALREVPSRLAAHLLSLGPSSGQAAAGAKVRLEMSKADLASLLGTAQETLSRSFARLRDTGLIEVRGSEILLLDPTRLLALTKGR